VKKKALFLINPIAGGKKKIKFPELIRQNIDELKFDYAIQFTESQIDTISKAKIAVSQNTEIVVAVGGDGTINDIAKTLVGSSSTLGIIPCGSGNGFARHLNIPLNPKLALELINKDNSILIDTGIINENVFINISGVGFDAHIGNLFSKSNVRGFKTYAAIVAKELWNYKSQKYKLELEGVEIESDAFMICICNGSQFGNNVLIAPNAKMDDGLFNITIVNRFNLFAIPNLVFKLFTGKIYKSSAIQTFSAKSLTISQSKDSILNIDGEVIFCNKSLNFKILPNSLKVLAYS